MSTGQCYAILPEISARLAKIQVPKVAVFDKNKWFIEVAAESKIADKIDNQPNNLNLENIEINADPEEFTITLKNVKFDELTFDK